MSVNLGQHMQRLLEGAACGVLLADARWLSLEDVESLRAAVPGRVVVVSNIDAVRFLPISTPENIGCVAGWISDEEVA